MHNIENENIPVVSIVIVCMNKPDNLRVCLGSIRKYTNVPYETFVVAYLFSKENLDEMRNEYPWVKFIESNEIRGFSENNNLALRQVKGKYCFVVNDDTEMKMPTIDRLVETIESLPEKVAIVSPNILKADGSVQFCGRPRKNWITMFFQLILHYDITKKSPYINKKGVFKSYNILGASFLIKTCVFEKVGWFDEKYFFCPEDIALSTHLNKIGYECWVDENVSIIHYEGMSGKSLSPLKMATSPAARRGFLILYSSNMFIWFFLSLSFVLHDSLSYLYCTIKVMLGNKSEQTFIDKCTLNNHLQSSFTMKTPKELFIKFYNEIESYSQKN